MPNVHFHGAGQVALLACACAEKACAHPAVQLFEVAEAPQDAAAPGSAILLRRQHLDLHTIELQVWTKHKSGLQKDLSSALAMPSAATRLHYECCIFVCVKTRTECNG